MCAFALIKIVPLGKLEGRGVECKNDISQPIGYTESLMRPSLAYVGNMVANIHTIPSGMKDK